jgi:membrane protease YdiL (CAAX protease family)
MASLILAVLILACFVMSSVLLLPLGAPPQVNIILAELVGFGLPAAFAYRRMMLPKEALVPLGWPRRVAPWRVAVAVALMPAFALAANALGGLAASLSPELAAQAAEYVDRVEEMLRPGDPLLAAVGIASVCVTAPLLEELAFRGALLSALRDDLADFAARAGPRRAHAAACAINGLAFGAIHFNLLSILPLSLFGAFLAHLTLRARSIWPAILAHAAFNTFNALVFPRLVEPGGEPGTLGEAALAAAVTCAIAAPCWVVAARLAAPSTLDAPPPFDDP